MGLGEAYLLKDILSRPYCTFFIITGGFYGATTKNLHLGDYAQLCSPPPPPRPLAFTRACSLSCLLLALRNSAQTNSVPHSEGGSREKEERRRLDPLHGRRQMHDEPETGGAGSSEQCHTPCNIHQSFQDLYHRLS